MVVRYWRLRDPWRPVMAFRWAAGLVVFLAGITTFLYFSPSAQAQRVTGAHRSANADNREIEQLIEALASRNEQPKFIEGYRATGGLCPLYDKKYDWSELHRVLKTLHVLRQQKAEELWPHLVKHLDDKRYAFTCEINGGVCNLTIGDICQILARNNLLEPFYRVWPNDSDVVGVICVTGKLFQPPFHRDLHGWCHAREAKPLWELQIEVGQWGIKVFEGLEGKAREKTAGPIEKTRAIAATLKQTKRPIAHNSFIEAHVFDAEEAIEVRDEYERLVALGLAPRPTGAARCDEKIHLQRTLGEWVTLAKHKDGRVARMPPGRRTLCSTPRGRVRRLRIGESITVGIIGGGRYSSILAANCRRRWAWRF